MSCCCIVVDSQSLSSSISASDAEQTASVETQPSVTEAGTQQTSSPVAVDESKSDDVVPIDSQLQPTDSTNDDISDKSEPDVKPNTERVELAVHITDINSQEGKTDTCAVEDVSKPTPIVAPSAELSDDGKKFSSDSDTSHIATVAKEAVVDTESTVKTRGKSRVVGKSVDAATDVDSSGVDSSAESGKTRHGIEDKTKTPRVKKKLANEDNMDRSEKKEKLEARKPTEDKTVDEECYNEEESLTSVKVNEEENSQKSSVADVKEKDDKDEFESTDQKGKRKDTGNQRSVKSHATRKGSTSASSDSSGREKRFRAQPEKTESSEVVERLVGRGRRKMKLGQPIVVLSEAENSQEPEQYAESSDSASNKLDTKTTSEYLSFEGLSVGEEFSRKKIAVSLENVTTKEQCYKTDVCESSSETTNSGAAAGAERMLRADEASLLAAAFTDSPAYTSADELGPTGGSSSSSAGGTGSLSPADEEHTSTKSELEANMEVAAYMGAGSTNEAELSSDDDSSSVNTSSRKPSVKSSSSAAKRKSDDGSFHHSGKCRRREKQHRTRSQHASTATKHYSYGNDGNCCCRIHFSEILFISLHFVVLLLKDC